MCTYFILANPTPLGEGKIGVSSILREALGHRKQAFSEPSQWLAN